MLCCVFSALGFASWQRALISRAGQSYTLEHGVSEKGDTLKIVTQDLRGTSELELPLSGQGVVADDGDGGARVSRAAHLERHPPAVVVTEQFPGEREPFSICRRTLQPDGRMCIDDETHAERREVAMRRSPTAVSGAARDVVFFTVRAHPSRDTGQALAESASASARSVLVDGNIYFLDIEDIVGRRYMWLRAHAEPVLLSLLLPALNPVMPNSPAPNYSSRHDRPVRSTHTHTEMERARRLLVRH